MDLNFFNHDKPYLKKDESLLVGTQEIPIRFVRNWRARRYILRVTEDGAARVTIPRGGSLREAWIFARRHVAWMEKQLQKRVARLPRHWQHGTKILFRGQSHMLEVEHNHRGGVVRFATEKVVITDADSDLRPVIERHLRRMATLELTARTLELAGQHGLTVRRITVRNQRSRWGSCSRKGTISLNWRLIQTPDFVRDYIILHELMHLREMNHSSCFWREVERVCPDFSTAERWLKQHRDLLR